MHRQRALACIAALAALAPSGCATCGSPQLRSQKNGYEIEVLVDGHPLAVYRHRGQSYVMGHKGARYVLRVHNRTHQRVEAVVSVDGRDVIDGDPASWDKRGYLIPAWGSVDIDGWRVSQSDVASFRFSDVRSSYAAQTGRARNVGVIGVALFPERSVRRRVLRPVPETRRDVDEAPAPAAAGSGAEDTAERSKTATERAPSSHERDRPGLATRFGERRYSPIQEIDFRRANPHRPYAVLGLHYDDRDGLVAAGIDLRDGARRDETDIRGSAHPFPGNRYATPPNDWDER